MQIICVCAKIKEEEIQVMNTFLAIFFSFIDQ